MSIMVISILYALVRAKHDSYINNGLWKLWAFIEGVLVAGSVGFLVGSSWIDYIFLPVIFGMVFWIVFDIACGIFRAGKLFYFGSGKFDQYMRRISGSALWLFIGKLIVLLIINGLYNGLIN
jgi:hypothetical protein